MGRIANGWRLMQASLKVLQADKELLVFPIISALGVLLVSAAFIAPVVLTHAHQTDAAKNPLAVLVGFAFYVVVYFVIFFCNSALVGAAMIRLRGGDPTVGDGVRIAVSKAGPIIGYALLAATVGMILKAIQERAGIIGKIISSIIGVAWNIATALAVPVLVAEDVGPIEAVKRSTQLMKKTWGEEIVGTGAIGSVFGLFIVLALVVFGGGAALVAQTQPVVALAIGGVGVLVIICLAILNATLSTIYQAAVYLYASEGQAQWFDAETIRASYRRR
ncbi:MAG: DUF6159 family protein [Myxococcaceae bacterium]